MMVAVRIHGEKPSSCLCICCLSAPPYPMSPLCPREWTVPASFCGQPLCSYPGTLSLSPQELCSYIYSLSSHLFFFFLMYWIIFVCTQTHLPSYRQKNLPLIPLLKLPPHFSALLHAVFLRRVFCVHLLSPFCSFWFSCEPPEIRFSCFPVHYRGVYQKSSTQYCQI